MEISELLSSLSENDIEQLKESAASLLGGLNIGGSHNAENSDDTEVADSRSIKNIDTGLDLGFNKILSNLGGVMNKPDVRCDFLLALKPLLREEHRERVDQSVKMLRLMNMLPMLRESGMLQNIF